MWQQSLTCRILFSAFVHLCYSGRRCQFNGKSFAFTLDQLVYVDLMSSTKTKTIISLIAVLLAVPNNWFSLMTLRRQDSLRNGVCHYLVCLSLVNQITLTLVIIGLVHIIIGISISASHSILPNICCKLFTYALTCFTRLSFWLSTFATLERCSTTVFLTRPWFKQPYIAHCLIIIKWLIIF